MKRKKSFPVEFQRVFPTSFNNVQQHSRKYCHKKCFEMFQCVSASCTENIGIAVTLYSVGTRFESWLGFWPPSLRFVIVSLCFSKRIPIHYLKTGHDCFLRNPHILIIHNYLPHITRRLGQLVAGIVGSNPAQGMDVCPRLSVLCCPV
jgi:hypothetical protein